jgi:hypothetical protein
MWSVVLWVSWGELEVSGPRTGAGDLHASVRQLKCTDVLYSVTDCEVVAWPRALEWRSTTRLSDSTPDPVV